MPKTMLIVQRMLDGLKESAEISADDLATWKKAGYEKVSERVVEDPEPVKGSVKVLAVPAVAARVDQVLNETYDVFDRLGLPAKINKALTDAGFRAFDELKTATDARLLKIDGITKAIIAKLRDALDGLDA